MTGPMALSSFSIESADTSRPTVALEPITVYVFEMRTGRVVDRVPVVGSPRWSAGLNTPGSWAVNVALRGHAVGAGLSPTTFEALTTPYRFGWAITQGSNIWQAGPVVAESWGGASSSMVSGGGFWQFLNAKRVLLNPARAALATVTGTDADVVFGPSGYVPVIGGTVPGANQNLSLHTIAKRIVSIIEGAAGGDLPVIYPDDIAGTSIREYAGYDLAYVGTRLLDLTQVVNGPEIVFKPEFVDGTTRQAIQFRMQIGNPSLGLLDFSRGWDAGKSLCGISNYASDGSAAATRAFERGNGMNRDTPVGFADDPTNPLDVADILLESVGNNHASASDVSTLNGWAQNAVNYGQTITPQLTARVRTAGDDGRGYQTRAPHQAEVNYGDNAVLQIRDSVRLPDGAYRVRIIGKAATDSPHETDMDCQLISRELK